MRKIIDLNCKWAFSKESGQIPEEFPDNWDLVNLPHCWNNIDGQDGGNDYYRGTCLYAKELRTVDLPAADRYYLEICGANSSADVYLNGRHLARHDGGYSTWRVDISQWLDENNLIVIAVDNSANDRVYPQVADFTFYGGLYRNVHIIAVNNSHFDLDYYGGSGLALTPVIDGEDANVKVESFVSNFKQGQMLRCSLKDAEGNTVESRVSDSPNFDFAIRNVHKWHGRKDPYLYTAQVELLEEGEVIDEVSARFGCRSFAVDAQRGFILNGEEYPLHGVSRHQDRKGLGNALLPRHHLEDMELICELGANTIRLAHYQHDQYFYDLCD